jgi:integrase
LFTLPWLYSKDLAGELETLVSSTTIRPFSEIFGWIESRKKFADGTKRSYLSLARKIERLCPGRSVKDMPETLATFREYCESEGITRSFNQCRSLFQAYATAIEGKHKPLWIAICNVPPIVYEVESGISLTYRDVRELGRKLIRPETDPHQMRDIEMLWSLVLTGMRKSEYLGSWSVAYDRVVIHNSKKSRQSGMKERAIPRFEHRFLSTATLTSSGHFTGPTDPLKGFQTFERRLRKVSNGKLSPHDFRHTFRTWLLLAGIPEVRAEAYMGHRVNPKNVTQVYSHHDVLPYLAEDRRALQTWLKEREQEWFESDYEHGVAYEPRDDPRDTPEFEYGRGSVPA